MFHLRHHLVEFGDLIIIVLAFWYLRSSLSMGMTASSAISFVVVNVFFPTRHVDLQGLFPPHFDILLQL